MQIMLVCTKYSAIYKKIKCTPNNKTDLLHLNSVLLLVNINPLTQGQILNI